jgi:HD-GYP domain-containing protein (c-di-GMP phosphodiesterase class II)
MTMNDWREKRYLKHARRLTAVGIALSAEHDTRKILDMIVSEAMDITNADAATLYLVSPAQDSLQFHIVRNRTLGINMAGRDALANWPDVPLRKEGQANLANVSACAAILKQPVTIADVYEVGDFDFSGTRRYDQQHNYRCKSMLVVPLKDHEDCVRGVLQLINAMDDTGGPIAFDTLVAEIVKSLASQAAMALNTARLIDALHSLFDGLIRTVAAAIDAKSAYTGGHVRRVTQLTLDIARAIGESNSGRFPKNPLDEKQFQELRTAAWLHDFGKVGTPESLLDKHTRLEKFVDRAEAVGLRYDVAILRAQLDAALAELRKTAPAEAARIADGDTPACRELTGEKQFVLKWNESPQGPGEQDVAALEAIARTRGTITPDELENLSIRKGTLNAAERKIIEDHAAVTRKTLSELSFPAGMANVPTIAGGHHEMLDGSGYPEGLKGDQIPLQMRILAIADIFEALTAERPYKKPMPVDRALSILNAMAKEGKLDASVIQEAVESGVFKRYAERELTACPPTAPR